MSETTHHESLLDRTLLGAWRVIAGVTRSKSPAFSADLPDAELSALKLQVEDCLRARGGEVSARARAASLGRIYLALNQVGRRRFLNLLVSEVKLDRHRVDDAIEGVLKAENATQRLLAERVLRESLRSPRLKLYRQFTALPDGVKFLVNLRADLLRLVRDDPSLEIMEAELKSMLGTWFDVGLLDLVRIEWDSPASLLEKLIEYEAVHQINDWGDMKNRLSTDRRCFAFFHRNMPNEPLIFVEVALVNGVSSNIQTLLDQNAPILDPNTADTAIFYSISNAQRGLAGISFGDILIKRVVDLLAREFPGLKTFATLSPVPGFLTWLPDMLESAGDINLPAGERKRLQELRPGRSVNAAILSLLEQPEWFSQAEIAHALSMPLMRLCASYLINEKHKNGFAANRVAHFHLSNGARIEQLNWLADTSPNGILQSAGIMVNYLYKLSEIESNHEVYRGEQKVRVSSSVKSLGKNLR